MGLPRSAHRTERSSRWQAVAVAVAAQEMAVAATEVLVELAAWLGAPRRLAVPAAEQPEQGEVARANITRAHMRWPRRIRQQMPVAVAAAEVAAAIRPEARGSRQSLPATLPVVEREVHTTSPVQWTGRGLFPAASARSGRNQRERLCSTSFSKPASHTACLNVSSRMFRSQQRQRYPFRAEDRRQERQSSLSTVYRSGRCPRLGRSRCGRYPVSTSAHTQCDRFSRQPIRPYGQRNTQPLSWS